MNEFEDMPVGDERERPLKDTEYTIKSVGRGLVICSRTGVKLIDFYRTSPVLVNDEPPNPLDAINKDKE